MPSADDGVFFQRPSLQAERNQRFWVPGGARDASRAVAPLKPAPGAVVIDSTDLSIDQVVQAVVNAWHCVSVQETGQLT